jgi:hypothetical protein
MQTICATRRVCADNSNIGRTMTANIGNMESVDKDLWRPQRHHRIIIVHPAATIKPAAPDELLHARSDSQMGRFAPILQARRRKPKFKPGF